MYVGFAFFCAIQAYALLGRWLQDHKLHAIQIEGRPYVSDFIGFYGSGVLARQCLAQPTKIYDSDTQIELERQLISPVILDAPFSNPNTPVTFVTFLPFSYFNLDGAWIAWGALTSAISVAVLFGIFNRQLKHWFARTAVIVGFLASYATWFSVRLGSTACLLFPMVLSFWHFLWQGRCVATAAVACVVTIKLQYLPFLFAVGLARLGWKFAGTFACMCTALLAICTLVLGWGNIEQFPQAFFANETTQQIVGVHPEKMQNLRGILVLLMGNDSMFIHIVCAAVWLMTAGLVFLLWRRLPNKDYVRFNLLASATTLLMLVSSPHTHIQDYIIAYIPCLMLYLVANRSDTNLDERNKLILKIAAVSFPYISWAMYVLLVELNSCKIQPFAFWAIALAAYTLALFFKGTRQIDLETTTTTTTPTSSTL